MDFAIQISRGNSYRLFFLSIFDCIIVFFKTFLQIEEIEKIANSQTNIFPSVN